MTGCTTNPNTKQLAVAVAAYREALACQDARTTRTFISALGRYAFEQGISLGEADARVQAIA